MKKILLPLLISLCFTSINAQEHACFLTDPVLSPDGSSIVFVYESDLWIADRSGGTAHRLTAMEGVESVPRFSPDGRWLAFSSTQDGNADIYIMPVDGGAITQLTYNDGNDYADSWSWDSKTIYFTSDRYNTFASYRVPVTGGTPVRMFSDNYFDQAHNLAELPDSHGTKFYFTSSWESFMFPQRKRYRGENNPDIEYFDTATGEYKKITDWEGKDMWPSVDRNGKLFFASDEGNDEYNLYTIENGKKQQLTSFPTSIKKPEVNAAGNYVVFARDYRIWIYDVAARSSSQCDIRIWTDETLSTEIAYKSAGKITEFDVSEDGKKMAFVSRGRLFVSDIAGKFIKEMPVEEKERVDEVRWMKDNQSLLYTRTVKGYTNLFTVSASSPEKEKQLTFAEKSVYELLVSPDGDKAVYVSGNDNINLIDLKSFESSTIIKDEFWFSISQPRFSPDNRYIVYTAFRNFEQDIFIYDTKEKSTITITDNGVTEDSPFWSPDGKYLYVSADRYKPQFPRGGGISKIYRIPLYRFAEDTRSDEYNKLFLKKPDKDSLKVDIIIDTDDIDERWEQLRVKGNEQADPNVFTSKGKTLVLFNNSPNPQERVLTKAELSPFEPVKSEKIGDKSFSRLICRNNKYYALMGGDVWEVRPAENKTEKINLNADFNTNLNDEFVQMFYENWATLAEYYYDKNYHGVDWRAIRDRYEQFLPLIRNRDNLRTIQNDMLGELNSSHLGFMSQGEEDKPFYKLRTNATGIVFSDKDPFMVKGWVKRSPVDIKDNKLEAGDELIAVNGVPVDRSKDRDLAFAFPGIEDELTLRFARKGKEFEITVSPVSSSTIKSLLYDEWVDNNRKCVDRLSGGRVAYVYMKDMSSTSLDKFLIDMTGKAMKSDALILDIRNNRGGNVHDDVIQFLSQRPYLEWQARNGKKAAQPNFAPSGKPIILMVNEQSLSDAEMTAAAFKALKLGTIIGTETYRWIIFTAGRQLVDGSYTRLPAWGCYDLAGNDLEKTGVRPDIYVKTTFGDMQNGIDPQLAKAVEEAMRTAVPHDN